MRMRVPEAGLSLRQPIRETCFSGYVELPDTHGQLVLAVEVVEPFQGEGRLEVCVITDDDDGFYTADVLCRAEFAEARMLTYRASLFFSLSGLERGRYLALQYVVHEGAFAAGKVTARIAADESPWFAGDLAMAGRWIPWGMQTELEH